MYYILKQLNSQRHNESLTDLFLQDGITFLREELVNKQNKIDKLLQVLSVDIKIIKRDEQKISHKSCQISLLTENCNSSDKAINIYNNLNDCISDQSNKTKEISTQTEHQQNSSDDELLNNASCDDVLASKNTTQKNAAAKINLENQLKEIRQIKHQNYTNSKYPPKEQSTKSSEEKHSIDNATYKWSKNTTLIVGDSMITSVDETMISRKGRVVKVDKLLSLKPFTEKTLPNCKISISNLIKRTENNEAAQPMDKANELLFTLQLDIVDNNNITKSELNRKGLHQNDIGYGKLAANFI